MLKPMYGEAPVVGYASTIADLQTDYEVYKLFYAACGNGTTMTPEQIIRYDELRKLFE